jgi:hypothetical protein
MRVFNRADLVSTEARDKQVIDGVPASASDLQNVFIRPWHLAFNKKAKNGRSPAAFILKCSHAFLNQSNMSVLLKHTMHCCVQLQNRVV